MEIKYWAGTDVGRKRSENEDNFLIDKRLKLFVVADGMGGHASGEIASAVAVHGIREIIDKERDILDTYDDDDPKSHVEVCTLLEYAVHHTCESIFQKARREPEKRGMGTTLVVLLIIGARGFIAYVGDSRIYLLRGGIVYQLTEDHSLKNELIRMGKITADEFESSPYANLKNAMTRAVGVYESVEVDTLDFDIIPGDSFLLCSDGLYEYLSEDDIANAIGLPEIREVPGMLIDSANSRGGKDNITAVVVQVAGDDDDDRAAELNFTLDTLKNVPLFRELSYQQLVRVMNMAKQSPVVAGQSLFAEGDVGNELLVVLRGRIEVTRDGVRVAEIQSGAHLGEMSLIDEGVRSASATALDAGKILSITRDDFYDVLRREPALAVKLLWSFVRVLAQRLRNTTADLATARSKVATPFPDLTELAEEAAKSSPELSLIDPDGESLLLDPLTDEELDEVELVSRQPDPSALPGMHVRKAALEERPTIELPPAGDTPLDGRTTLINTRTTDINEATAGIDRTPKPASSPPPADDRPPVVPRARPPSRPSQMMPALDPNAGAPSASERAASNPLLTGDTVVPTSASDRDTVIPKAGPEASTPPPLTGDTEIPTTAPETSRKTAPSNTPPDADVADRVTIIESGAPKSRRKTEPALPIEALPTRRPDAEATRPLDAADLPLSAPSSSAPVVPSTGRATVPVEASPPLRPPVGPSPKRPMAPKVPRRTASRSAISPQESLRSTATARPNAPTVSSPVARTPRPPSIQDPKVGGPKPGKPGPKPGPKPGSKPGSAAAKPGPVPKMGPAPKTGPVPKSKAAGSVAAPPSTHRPSAKSEPKASSPRMTASLSTPPAASTPRRPSGHKPTAPAAPRVAPLSEADAPQPRKGPRRNTLRSMPGPPAAPAADLPGTPPPDSDLHQETIIGHLPPPPPPPSGGTAPSPMAEIEARAEEEAPAPPQVGHPPVPRVPGPPATPGKPPESDS